MEKKSRFIKDGLGRLMSKESALLKGFTMLEMAICVLILALFVGAYLAFYRVDIAVERVQGTQARMDDIRSALSLYKLQHGRLPCPAPMDARPDAATYGQSVDCTAAVAGTWRPAGTGGRLVRIGAVPVVTLGLPIDSAADKWGHRFVYAVTEQHANASPINPQMGAITLVGNAGGGVMGPLPGRTSFVLISPSRTGAGAYTAEGTVTTVACPAAPAPNSENCDFSDATFRAGSFSDAANNADRFDAITNATLPAQSPAAICGNMGKLYGPAHPFTGIDDGCVTQMIENHSGVVSFGPPLAPSALSGAPLEVNGALRIGINSAAPLPCAGASSGALRYNSLSPSPVLEWCNGGSWTSLEGVVGDQGPIGDQGDNVVGDPGPPGDQGPPGIQL